MGNPLILMLLAALMAPIFASAAVPASDIQSGLLEGDQNCWQRYQPAAPQSDLVHGTAIERVADYLFRKGYVWVDRNGVVKVSHALARLDRDPVLSWLLDFYRNDSQASPFEVNLIFSEPSRRAIVGMTGPGPSDEDVSTLSPETSLADMLDAYAATIAQAMYDE